MKGLFDCRWFGWFSAVIVVGYFIVGLWPFAFLPANQVRWLPGRPGLHFAKSGVAYDSECCRGGFPAMAPQISPQVSPLSFGPKRIANPTTTFIIC